MTLRLGYKASAEQFGPRDLVEFAVRAEELGFDSAMTSDHFLPWRHNGGHAPFALAWLTAVGERTSRIRLGTSVLTPTFRYNPAVIAQAFSTLALLYPGRVRWNEIHVWDPSGKLVHEDAFPGMTLVQVLAQGGGGLKALGRHTVAALLNASSAEVNYDLGAGDIIDMFNDAYPGDTDAYEDLKNVFEGYNEQLCPLDRAELEDLLSLTKRGRRVRHR